LEESDHCEQHSPGKRAEQGESDPCGKGCDLPFLHGLATARTRRKSGAQNPEVRVQFAKTRLEIRKDLGAETPGLSAETLQQLLFANADKVNISPKPISYQDR